MSKREESSWDRRENGSEQDTLGPQPHTTQRDCVLVQLLSLVPGACLGWPSSLSSVTAKANTASPELRLLPGPLLPIMEITQLEEAGL